MRSTIQNIIYIALVVTIWWAIWSIEDLVAVYLHNELGYSYLGIYIITILIVITILVSTDLKLSV